MSEQYLRYKLAKSDEDLSKVDLLWKKVYVEEKKWLPSCLLETIKDKYHPYSSYILATTANDAPVGTMRIVFDSEVGLPIEQFFPLNLLKETTNFAESQRMMIASEYRNCRFNNAPFGAGVGLIKACIHFCFLNKISHVVADVFINTSTTPIEKFKMIGFEEIGADFQDTELSDSSKSIAMLLTFPKLLSKIYKNRGEFFNYLISFDSAFEFYEKNRV